jgi:hypothetical protein
MTNEKDSEQDKMLRSEVIESQKTQADFLKWKIIAVATVASISFGLASTTNSNVQGAKLLLCLVPLICAYVDLTSLHIMIRIIMIGIYLKTIGNGYEAFVFEVRERKGANPFVFEALALHGSSLVFNIIIVVIAFVLPEGADNWPANYLSAYRMSGGLGIVATLLLWGWYNNRAQEIVRVAELTIK